MFFNILKRTVTFFEYNISCVGMSTRLYEQEHGDEVYIFSAL